MTESFTPTVKARYTTDAGSVLELVIPLDVEDVQALIDQALHIDALALETGLNIANPMVKGVVDSAKAAGVETTRKGNEVFHCVSIDILPQADGRTKVAFFGNGYKQPRDDYATVTSMFSPKDTVALLEPYYKFKEQTLLTPSRFNVDFYVEIYDSTTLNRNGKPYKNISRNGIHVKEGAAPPEKVELQAEAPPPAQQDEIPF